MGLTFSSRSDRPVRHEVHHRTFKKTIEIPGVTTANYESQSGYVYLIPLNQTIDTLRRTFLDDFGIEMKSNHHFSVVYCFGPIVPGKQMLNILKTTKLIELIENPEVRFVFSYLSLEEPLLE